MASAAEASSTIRALVPAPSGYVVNFANPQRHPGVPLVYWITGVMLALATCALAMRIYTRVRLVKEFKAEDCTIQALCMLF